MHWLVPDHLASDFPPYFSHCECDSPRDSQPFLPFALVIEIEPVTSRGPCNTVQLSPDGLEGFNVFLHGLFASDFVESVADVPTSAVVRRARDGAIHGIFSQGSEYFSGVSKQKPALPAGEDGGYHVRRNHGQTHTLLQPRDAHLATSVDHALLPRLRATPRFCNQLRMVLVEQPTRLLRRAEHGAKTLGFHPILEAW